MAELQEAEEALPKLSPAAIELAALAASGEYNARIVGDLLDQDENLSAQVIRLANSVVYGGQERIETSAQAVQRIEKPFMSRVTSAVWIDTPVVFASGTTRSDVNT